MKSKFCLFLFCILLTSCANQPDQRVAKNHSDSSNAVSTPIPTETTPIPVSSTLQPEPTVEPTAEQSTSPSEIPGVIVHKTPRPSTPTKPKKRKTPTFGIGQVPVKNVQIPMEQNILASKAFILPVQLYKSRFVVTNYELLNSKGEPCGESLRLIDYNFDGVVDIISYENISADDAEYYALLWQGPQIIPYFEEEKGIPFGGAAFKIDDVGYVELQEKKLSLMQLTGGEDDINKQWVKGVFQEINALLKHVNEMASGKPPATISPLPKRSIDLDDETIEAITRINYLMRDRGQVVNLGLRKLPLDSD